MLNMDFRGNGNEDMKYLMHAHHHAQSTPWDPWGQVRQALFFLFLTYS
jgi:hypothetical protein